MRHGGERFKGYDRMTGLSELNSSAIINHPGL